MQNHIELLRVKVLELNHQMFSLIRERRLIVSQIQSLKSSEGKFPYFDSKREIMLFEKLAPDLKMLSLKELLSFSLLMEGQADPAGLGLYPQFSFGDHLEDKNRKGIIELINPILLHFYNPELEKQLNLKKEFRFFETYYV